MQCKKQSHATREILWRQGQVTIVGLACGAKPELFRTGGRTRFKSPERRFPTPAAWRRREFLSPLPTSTSKLIHLHSGRSETTRTAWSYRQHAKPRGPIPKMGASGFARAEFAHGGTQSGLLELGSERTSSRLVRANSVSMCSRAWSIRQCNGQSLRAWFLSLSGQVLIL